MLKTGSIKRFKRRLNRATKEIVADLERIWLSPELVSSTRYFEGKRIIVCNRELCTDITLEYPGTKGSGCWSSHWSIYAKYYRLKSDIKRRLAYFCLNLFSDVQIFRDLNDKLEYGIVINPGDVGYEDLIYTDGTASEIIQDIIDTIPLVHRGVIAPVWKECQEAAGLYGILRDYLFDKGKELPKGKK